MSNSQCDTCGNKYDKAFKVAFEGRAYTFDSFECAIQALAPQCSHCGCRIIGHGVQSGEKIYCCAHCAHVEGHSELKDRVNESSSSGKQKTA